MVAHEPVLERHPGSIREAVRSLSNGGGLRYEPAHDARIHPLREAGSRRARHHQSPRGDERAASRRRTRSSSGCWDDFAADPDCWVAILTGRGREGVLGRQRPQVDRPARHAARAEDRLRRPHVALRSGEADHRRGERLRARRRARDRARLRRHRRRGARARWACPSRASGSWPRRAACIGCRATSRSRSRWA